MLFLQKFILRIFGISFFAIVFSIFTKNISANENSITKSRVNSYISELEIVLLKFGEAEGIKKGSIFTISRKNQYIGGGIITDVYLNMSIGKLRPALNNEKGLKIEKGDEVIFENDIVEVKKETASNITIDKINLPLNPIEAKIIAAIPEGGLVMLDAGKNKEIKVGYLFSVSRKEETIGCVQVIETHPQMAACRIFLDSKNKKGLRMERGDVAKLISFGIDNSTDVAFEKNSDKLIEGKVITNLKEANAVFISVGKVEGVKLGNQCDVSRKGIYIGKLEINDLYENMSSGKVLVETEPKKMIEIERGDDVKFEPNLREGTTTK